MFPRETCSKNKRFDLWYAAVKFLIATGAKMRSRNQCWTLLAVVMVVAAFTAVTSANRTDRRPADDPGLYNVKTFGAKADGKTIDTPAINKGIDAAAAACGDTALI